MVSRLSRQSQAEERVIAKCRGGSSNVGGRPSVVSVWVAGGWNQT